MSDVRSRDPMVVFRISHKSYTQLNGIGAFLKGGRWNSPGHALVYAAETYAGALFETLVHMTGLPIPKTQQVVRIEIPDTVMVETLRMGELPGWDLDSRKISQAFGDVWLEESRSAVLRVPSVVLQGREFNVLLNPAHADFSRIQVSIPEDVDWDPRVFATAKP